MESLSTFKMALFQRLLSLTLLIPSFYVAAQEAPFYSLPNTTQVVWSGPELAGTYIGSPSLVRCPTSGELLTSHDEFGRSYSGSFIHASKDDGKTFTWRGTSGSTYWATLFTRANDPAVYLLGTSLDPTSQVAIARTLDCGATWVHTILTNFTQKCSTGPTPVLAYSGRLWRAFERNDGPIWSSNYSSFVMSAPQDSTTDLMDPASWVASGGLNFNAVMPLVPPSWSNPAVENTPGWLEGNAVAPPSPTDTPGIYIMLRVNSLPAGNKAALLHLPSPTSTPTFISFLEFPGGMSKFTVRQDPTTTGAATPLYLSLVNPVRNEGVSEPPLCPPSPPSAGGGGLLAPPPPRPCCGMDAVLACPNSTTPPPCLWCHSNARNVLSLAVSTSPTLSTWTLVKTLMEDDQAMPGWMSELMTGLQYVDFLLEGEDLLVVVRAGYRGANCYHNSNRILFQRVVNWRSYLTAGGGGGGGGREGGQKPWGLTAV